MINEKMLEYLMLGAILDDEDAGNDSDARDNMIERFIVLEDEFINQYKLPKPIINDPVTDTKGKEE